MGVGLDEICDKEPVLKRVEVVVVLMGCEEPKISSLVPFLGTTYTFTSDLYMPDFMHFFQMSISWISTSTLSLPSFQAILSNFILVSLI